MIFVRNEKITANKYSPPAPVCLLEINPWQEIAPLLYNP
jgi:hypothetical protein